MFTGQFAQVQHLGEHQEHDHATISVDRGLALPVTFASRNGMFLGLAGELFSGGIHGAIPVRLRVAKWTRVRPTERAES